ncbi:hypothetical protein D0Q02_18935 [Micromonospora craniellae]|uniref:Uncharacterized protein n=1 Tax=Micromonospora craniellae TaxID=2294034 RepID=A0A372FX39_9ACTN|nr:hypothetical protein D0Q02_18935 [Micromonospora craniellae]
MTAVGVQVQVHRRVRLNVQSSPYQPGSQKIIQAIDVHQRGRWPCPTQSSCGVERVPVDRLA